MEAGRRPRQASVATQLGDGASGFGVKLSEEQIEAFETYVKTLLLWASRLSLTAARTAREITEKHLVDSLSIVPWIQTGWKVADLGSGAGFPGIPLAIARPDISVVLVESRRKRANFLREAARQCRLGNAVVAEARAEALVVRAGAAFDAVVSRAVWPLADFLAVGHRLLRAGGLAIAMKASSAKVGLADEPGFFPPYLATYTLAGGIERILLVYRRR